MSSSSTSTLRGLCAGYFVWDLAERLMAVPQILSLLDFKTKIPLTYLGQFFLGPGIVLLLTFASAFAGIQLLRDRPKAALHAMYVAWITLVWTLAILSRSTQFLLEARNAGENHGALNFDTAIRPLLIAMIPLIVLIPLLHRLNKSRRPESPTGFPGTLEATAP